MSDEKEMLRYLECTAKLTQSTKLNSSTAATEKQQKVVNCNKNTTCMKFPQSPSNLSNKGNQYLTFLNLLKKKIKNLFTTSNNNGGNLNSKLYRKFLFIRSSYRVAVFCNLLELSQYELVVNPFCTLILSEKKIKKKKEKAFICQF